MVMIRLRYFWQLAGAQWGSAWAVEDLSSSPGWISHHRHHGSGFNSGSSWFGFHWLGSKNGWDSNWDEKEIKFCLNISPYIPYLMHPKAISWSLPCWRSLRFSCLVKFSSEWRWLHFHVQSVQRMDCMREWSIHAFIPKSHENHFDDIHHAFIHNRFKFGGMGCLACNDDKSHCRY